MAVIRVEKNKNYTVMSNVHLRDKALSLKAKGLLSLILSLPDDWQYNVKGLAAISKEGRSGITSGLQELEAAGYLERRQLRGEHGKLAQVEYVVFEAPRPPLAENPATAKPATADPATENPVTGNPVTEDRAQISTEEQITEKQNTDLSNIKKYAGEKQLTNEMVLAFIKKVLITDGEHIEILWNFSDVFLQYLKTE